MKTLYERSSRPRVNENFFISKYFLGETYNMANGIQSLPIGKVLPVSKRKFNPRLPPAPKTLGTEAAAWWKRILTDYAIEDEAGLLLFQTALEAFSRMRQASELLASEGLTTTDRYGQHKQHPAAAIERDQQGKCRPLASIEPASAAVPKTAIRCIYGYTAR